MTEQYCTFPSAWAIRFIVRQYMLTFGVVQAALLPPNPNTLTISSFDQASIFRAHHIHHLDSNSMESSSMTPEEQRTDRPTVLAGIDFGTTYMLRVPGSRWPVPPWPLSNLSIKSLRVQRGKDPYKIPKEDIQWPGDVRVSAKLEKLTKEREALDVSAVDASSKYLGELWKQFHENLDKDINVEITVTVPAIWPEDARERLLQALRSRSANILGTNVRLAQNLVTESEAAAIALLSASANPGILEGLNFNAKDTVIICDCGGGTTDLISFQVRSMEPLAVREISPSKCIYAGAALLDDGFMKLLRAKTQAERPRNAVKDLTDKNYDKFANDIWHNDMKKNHCVNIEGQTFDLPLKFIGKQVGVSTMEFTAADIHGVFDPVVNKITNLVESEMAIVEERTGKQATHVVIAGGFGRNSYLRHKIEDKVRSVSPLTRTNQYEDDTGWISVARGAVLHAIQTKSQSAPSIEARASGESYGVGIGNGGFIHWLVRWGDELSAEGLNPRPVPPEAVRRSPDGRCFLDWYRVKGPGAKAEIVRPLYYRNAAGELGDLRFDFNWDGTKMHYVLCQGNQQPTWTLGDEYDA
ncbi:hypothetical protein FMUND_11297 [Fusarium mundagurra]|uniref:Actin-like ATPase domain-containing protein n=1 Tax=Fusarium mundagurra TaxID=1567541 RepID=A0A8H6D7P9_9HYPO|nr:hypothetical protein FMUND_11297 [Fusarium mundagurra]